MKKMIFALFAGMFAVILSGCSKSEELAGVLEVSVQMLTSKQPLPDYPVIITKSISSTPYVEFKRGVTDKDGVCRFEFKSGELSEYNVVDGNYFEGYAVVLDPTTGTSVGARNFLLQQGKTLQLPLYVRQDE